MKAPERPCRGCGTLIPAQPSSRGRPRQFCTAECRPSFHYERERERLEVERRAAWERARYRLDLRRFGKRKADQFAKERAERRKQ